MINSSTAPLDIQEARRTKTVWWILCLATVGLIFDGYDLVVYGAVVSTFLRDASQIGAVTPAMAGALGSYALFGVAVGALLAGSVGDIIGRRKVMLTSYAWFSIGMALTATSTDAQFFGWMRFMTGLGIGSLVATTAALVAEYAPKDKKNLFIAISNGGIPLGSMLSAVLAMVWMEHIGWRGMFWIGALPILTLLPLAYFKMPESVAWLASRGRMQEAQALAEQIGVPLPELHAHAATAAADNGPSDAHRSGFSGLFSAYYLFPTLVLGLMSATGLLLVYSLNTWLPELMLRAGYNTKGSLAFLAVLNGGSLFGAMAASRLADRWGPKPVVAASFATGALALVLLTLDFPLAGLLGVVAIVGLGTSGTQTLIYAFVANYYRTNVRASGVAWCAGFGRLGGIGGPMLGSFLITSGLPLDSIFYILAAIALLGVMLTLLVPLARSAFQVAAKGSSKAI